MFKRNSVEALSPIPDEVYCFAEWQNFSPQLTLKFESSPEEKNEINLCIIQSNDTKYQKWTK